MFLWSGSKFLIFDHVESENLQYLAKTKKGCAKFFISFKLHENVSENQQEVGKMLGEKLVIFALDLKLDWATVTLLVTSAPKFLWSILCFDK